MPEEKQDYTIKRAVLCVDCPAEKTKIPVVGNCVEQDMIGYACTCIRCYGYNLGKDGSLESIKCSLTDK
jgi:hypothetical protein